MMIAKQLRSATAACAFIAAALALTGCGQKTATAQDYGTSAGGLLAGSDTSTYSYADVQTAAARAERIRNLLANCTGPGAAVANVEAANMAKAQLGLQSITAASDGASRDSAVNAMLTVQAGAYQAAVDCGLVAPGVPDPGGWNATWDDISS